jgi:hypothetical protein
MNRLAALALLVSVWTYGAEPLDTIAARTEWDTFSRILQCRPISGGVECLVGDTWQHIDDKQLPAPWGVE